MTPSSRWGGRGKEDLDDVLPPLPTDLRASWCYVRGPKGGKWLCTFEKKKEVCTALNVLAEEELKKRHAKFMPSMELKAMKKAMKAAMKAKKA